MRKTLIRDGRTQCKLPNRPGGLFYPSALYSLFTCCTSYQIGQTDFHPLALLRLAAQAIEQARRTFTLWHFYGLLDCETPNRSDRLPPSDTWRLYYSQSAWVRWWPKSQTAFDLHALSVWSANIIATLVSRWLGGKVPWMRMARLTCMVWCWCNEVDRKTRSSGEKGWRMKLTSHV